jgi:hypothetical protein
MDFLRVSYDVDEAADAIRKSDLADEFAEVLETGGARIEAAAPQ